jgi:hypothetical protein
LNAVLQLFDLMTKSHEGLIPSERSVRRKGKVFQQTYWVKPGEAVPSKVKAARKEAARRLGHTLKQFADINMEDEQGQIPETPPLSVEKQKDIRSSVSTLLDSYGLENWAKKKDLPGQYHVVNQWLDDTTEDIPGGRLFRLDIGTLHIGKSDHVWAGKFFRDDDKPVKDRWGDLETKVLIHEAIHGSSPITMTSYSGATQPLEEGTVEIIARKIMRDQYGVGKRSGVGRLPRGKKPGEKANAYDSDIIFLRNAVTDATGMSMDDAFEVLENASFSYRRKGSRDTQIDTSNQLGPVGDFARHLDDAITEKLGTDWKIDWRVVQRREWVGQKRSWEYQDAFYRLQEGKDPSAVGVPNRVGGLWTVLNMYCWEAGKYL